MGATVDPDWRDWLDGAALVARDDGTCLIRTVGCDQAMLLGLIVRLRDLGIPLIGVYPDRNAVRPVPASTD